ncbi:MAG: hypothetical protein GOV00_03375 [Candidatus Altiarchaeota archaeon]|nr:hypothetical protein [Candidatus Altiarchaeota archaeon]
MNELLLIALVLPFLGRHRKTATVFAFIFAIITSLRSNYLIAVFFFILSLVIISISHWKDAKYPLFFLAMFDLIGLLNSQNFLELFLYFELAIFASYFLIFDRKNFMPLIRYFIVNSIGSALMIFAIALSFMSTGSLSHLSPTALILFVLGLLIKLGIAPFQDWLVEIYKFVPLSMALFFSTVLTEIAPLALLIVVTVRVPSLEIFAMFSMFLASVMAFSEKNMIRMLALIDASNLAYDVLAIAIATPASRSAALFMMFSHVIAMCLVFTVLIISKSKSIDKLRAPKGLVLPFYSAFFALSGLPPFQLFPSKIMLFTSVFDVSHPVSYFLLFNMGLSALVSLRILASIRGTRNVGPIDPKLKILVWGLLITSVVFGLFPRIFFEGVLSQMQFLGGPIYVIQKNTIPLLSAIGQTISGIL